MRLAWRGCCRPNTTMTGSHSHHIRTLIWSRKTRRLPIVVNVTVATLATVTRENRDQGSIFRQETRICEATAVLYYYN